MTALTENAVRGKSRGGGDDLPVVAYPLTAHPGGYRDGDTDTTYVAAPLSHGSNPNSNMAGRRREDDENLVPAVGWNWQTGGDFRPMVGEQAPALQKNQTTAVGVRRLTPTECERLQGLPDGWTGFGPDSRRYAALGDAVTATVAEWIGRRILEAT